MSRIKATLLVSAATIQVALAFPAMAQESGSAAGNSPATAEIVVTALRRAQSVQDIPAAVSAVSGEALEKRGITDPSDLQFITPNLQVGKSQGNTAFTIRGVGFNTVGSPAIAVHVDGVFQPRPSMGDLAQIDVARVEVLRGPQGTLYGRNANGGVINFISNRPTDVFEGKVTARYANFDQLYLEGVVNVPLGEGVGTRLVLAHKEQGEGFIKNLGDGPDLLDEGYTAARLAFDFAPTDALKVQLTGTYVHRDGAVYSSIAQTRPRTSGVRGAPFGDLAAYGGDVYTALGAQWSGKPNTSYVNDASSSNRDAWSISGVVDWDLGGDLKLHTVTAYQDFDEKHRSDLDGSSASIYLGRIDRTSKTFTQELNLNGTVGPLDFIIGGFYMKEDFAQDLVIEEPNGNGSFLPGSTLNFITPYYKTKAVAAYTDLTLNVTDNLRLIGGLRHSRDRQTTYQDFLIDADILVAPGTTINLGQQCLGRLPKLKFNSTTPRLGIQFDASSDTTFYGNYTKGFKVGGYNTDGTCNDEYEPEKITAYEAGIKNSFLNGQLTLNLTGFYYDYTNLQLQQIIGVGVSIINAPAARIKGLEVETTWHPSREFSAFGSLSLLDAKYTNFITSDGAQNDAIVDLKGNYLNNAPKVSVNLGVDITPGQVFGGDLNFRADTSYRSETFVRETNDPRLERNRPYFITNASLSWTSPNDRFLVRAFVTNLFDEVYITQSQWSATIGARAVSYNTPRQYGLETQFKF